MHVVVSGDVVSDSAIGHGFDVVIPQVYVDIRAASGDVVFLTLSDEAFVLEDSGRIRGVLILEHRPDGMLLNNVAVHPESQGRGHGRTLIAHAEAEARQHGYRQIWLYTHVLMTENQALYRRVGFIETGRVIEEGFDRVYMVKELI